jgi:superfamily I DNA/RNA helicase
LEKPNLFETEEVDCVMVDEGQDLNGAMLDIFLSNIGPRIIVGDPHQQIYRWRKNSINSTFIYLGLPNKFLSSIQDMP